MAPADRKVCYLGMPSYGELTPGAARAFYVASRSGELGVQLRHEQSSLLALNFNTLWCWALNARHRGERVDYWAMQHADVEPDPGWLDVMVGELESHGLDVLSAAVPIKDQRGVTSIAMARDDGDPWRVHGRLTVRECHRLPETFAAKDVGRPLLVNTGLLLVRWDQEWAKQVHFTVNDRIVFNPEKESYFAEVEPEDWFFGRLANDLGLKVGVTRKVRVGHRGPMTFGNDRPWGTMRYDEAHLTESVLDAGLPPFPHDVPGWLTEEEGRELMRLAAGKAVLEVGSYCGRSTVCLARTAGTVSAVDTFDGRGTALEGDTYPTFLANLERYGVADKVAVYRGTSGKVLPPMPPVFDLAFIDGSHDFKSVLRDAALAADCLRPGGLLAFHDYDNAADPGVRAAVDALAARGAAVLSTCGSIAVVRPAPRPQLAEV